MSGRVQRLARGEALRRYARPTSGLPAPNPIGAVDQEDHPRDGAHRRVADLARPAAGQRVQAVRRRDHPRHHGGGQPDERRPPADHRAQEPAPGRPCSSSPATAAWPAPTAPTPCGRRSRSTRPCARKGKESAIYAVGRKAVSYYRFRNRKIERDFTGFSEQPDYDSAKAVADALIEQFVKPTEEGGVDEIHVVFTEFAACSPSVPSPGGSCRWSSKRPPRSPPDGPLPLYEFEPSAEEVLDALLPRYVESRVFAALLRIGGLGVGGSPPGHEVGDGQRGRAHQVAHASGQLGPSGRDHPRDQ